MAWHIFIHLGAPGLFGLAAGAAVSDALNGQVDLEAAFITGAVLGVGSLIARELGWNNPP